MKGQVQGRLVKDRETQITQPEFIRIFAGTVDAQQQCHPSVRTAFLMTRLLLSNSYCIGRAFNKEEKKPGG
jgi:hypothetical protein